MLGIVVELLVRHSIGGWAIGLSGVHPVSERLSLLYETGTSSVSLSKRMANNESLRCFALGDGGRSLRLFWQTDCGTPWLRKVDLPLEFRDPLTLPVSSTFGHQQTRCERAASSNMLSRSHVHPPP
jgi:hypothetical protein